MKNTNIPLLKFKCDNKGCQFEFYINRYNNVITAYSSDFATLLDWICPECRIGALRYASTNAQFEFSLTKQEKCKKEDVIDPQAKYIDPED